MNWVDVVLIAGLLAGVAIGWKAGLMRLASTLIGSVVATIIAGQFDSDLAGRLSFISNADAARISAFVIIFLIVLIAFEIGGTILRTMTHLMFIGWLESAAGMVLGFLAAAFMLGVLASLLGNFAGGKFQQDVQESRLAQVLVDKVPVVEGLLPSDFKKLKDLSKQNGQTNLKFQS